MSSLSLLFVDDPILMSNRQIMAPSRQLRFTLVFMLSTRNAFVRRTEKSNESSIQTNVDDSQTSTIDQSATNISEALVTVQQLIEKQNLLEEKLTNLRDEILTRDSIDEFRSLFNTVDALKQFDEDFFDKKLRFFRTYFSAMCPNTNHWKILAHGLVRLENSIKNFENFQLKKLLRTKFDEVFGTFVTLMKKLIKTQIEEKEDNEESMRETSIELDKFRNDLENLKSFVLTIPTNVSLCQNDRDELKLVVDLIDQIPIDSHRFNDEDEQKLRIYSLREDLATKSNRTDLVQLKTYFENQMKKIIEINRQNAKELERLKSIKTSTCQTREIQKILSSTKVQHRMNSYQSCRPYLTFELEQIRNYHRRALIRSPYGSIPLYRRQAWIAANLLPNRTLHFVQHQQKTIRIQIRDLFGFHPADRWTNCEKNSTKKKSNLRPSSTTNRFDLPIVGTDQKMYRGEIETCENRIFQKTKTKEKKKKDESIFSTKETNETKKMHLDQFDRTIRTIGDEHLFEYLDWDKQIHQQDLPNELCEDLFDYWKSLVCPDRSTDEVHSSPSKQEEEEEENDQSVSSESSCPKVDEKAPICLCSQCSCPCLKNVMESLDDEKTVGNERQSVDEVKFEPITVDQSQQTIDEIVEKKEEEIIQISSCFANGNDRWSQQLDPFQKHFQSQRSTIEKIDWTKMNRISSENLLFQTAAPIAFGCFQRSIEQHIDDPTAYRRKILHQQLDES